MTRESLWCEKQREKGGRRMDTVERKRREIRVKRERATGQEQDGDSRHIKKQHREMRAGEMKR